MESFDFVLIDDNNLDNLIHETLVRNSGVGGSVLVFNSANSALNYFQNIPVHSSKVILLDQHMPDMEGTDFMQKLKDVLKDSFGLYTIILLSGDNKMVKLKNELPYLRDVWSKPLKISKLESLSAEP
ncbi:response regulator [Luteibaculum oceani]|uniref:Response regulator n=1 Tax=Luteibaculum oceani TaxID=1294296 RepID=A0A5C6V0T6_9FLAO|nr:response regulator [Luteibaculum oceani]TXC78480.1 response regulator [Luteibaculum oceani]